MSKLAILSHTFEIASGHADPSIVMPGQNQYGGADVTIATDGAGTDYVAFCGRERATNVFGFYIYNLTTQQKVPYAPFCTGRGTINNGGRWIAWNNADFYTGMIPGFAPHAAPSGGALSTRYTAALDRLCAFLGI